MDIASAVSIVTRVSLEQLVYLAPFLLIASLVSAAMQVLVPPKAMAKLLGSHLKSLAISSVLELALPHAHAQSYP